MTLENRQRWSRFLVAFAAAAVAALGLGALGLSEISWAPFFLVAADSAGRGVCLDALRRRARS